MSTLSFGLLRAAAVVSSLAWLGCCSTRSAPTEADSGDVVDLRSDALVKTYPWVSTYLSPRGCGEDVQGHRLEVKLQRSPSFYAVTGLGGELVLTANSRVLYVDGNHVKPLVDKGNHLASWARLQFPARVDDVGLGPSIWRAAASVERLYFALQFNIFVLEKGWLRLLAGTVGGTAPKGIRDGRGEDVRFRSIMGLTPTGPEELIIIDAFTLRRAVGDRVTTIAGSRQLGPLDLPEDGDALTEATLAGPHALAVVGQRILLFDRGLLRELFKGRITTLGGSYWKYTNTPTLRDGPVAQATFGNVGARTKVIGSDVYFTDRGKDEKVVLRRLRGGVVETLMTFNWAKTHRDGPAAAATFEAGILVPGGGDRLFVSGDGCRVREIELD